MNTKKMCCILLGILLVILMPIGIAAASSVPEPVLTATESVVRILSEYTDGSSTGTGFVIKSDREETLIATNYHVVEGAPYNISVWLNGDETVSTSIVAYTDQKDLCILRLAYPVALQPLPLAQTGVRQGEAVYAVGYPAAADSLSDKEAHSSTDATVTDGIISALREVTVSDYGTPVKLLQTSAAINPGNSGGPLFNAAGEVVGINTYRILESQGIFGAVDVSELRDFLLNNSLSVPENNSARIWMIFLIIVVFLAVAAAGILLVPKKKKITTPTAVSDNTIVFHPCTNTPTETSLDTSTEEQPFISAVPVFPTRPIKKPRCSAKRSRLAAILVLPLVLFGTYFGSYAIARNHAQNGDFAAADKWLFAAPVTRLHDTQLPAYIAAGVQLESRNYTAAADAFRELSGYQNADALAQETSYRYAIQLADANQFDAAIQQMTKLSSVGYKDSAYKLLEICYRKGAYHLSVENDISAAAAVFAQLINKGYPVAEKMTIETKELIYTEGQNLYHQRKYNEASSFFSLVSSFADSQKYLTLIEAHHFKTAQYSSPKLLDSLIEIFYFEDAAKLLLSYQAISQDFLKGTWRGGGYYFTMSPTGNITYSLPVYEGVFEAAGVFDQLMRTNISNSTVSFDHTPLFCINALSPDCIEVYCYQNGQTYTLYRE